MPKLETWEKLKNEYGPLAHQHIKYREVYEYGKSDWMIPPNNTFVEKYLVPKSLEWKL